MFKEELKQGIRFRFLTVMFLILFINTVVLSIVITINEKTVLRNSLTTKGQSLASFIAKLSRDPLLAKDSLQLDSIVNDANKDDDIAYTVIHDEQGNLLTSQYASINYRSPRLVASLSGLSRDSEFQDIINAVKKQEPLMEISVPIMIDIKPVGKVTVGISGYRIGKEIKKTLILIIALNLVIAFILGAALFAASKKIILNPIAELANAASRLAKGDLSTRVETRASGEMQMLVDNFNRMAEDLGQRTSELIEAQGELMRKEKLAILGQLAGSVGHELRNPLGVMSNAVYYLKTVMSGADETVKEYLNIIKGEINNSERIISDLIDFTHTKMPQTKSVTVRELITRRLGACVIPDSITVQVNIPETLPAMRVDPLQIGQVFQNLATNAIQGMPGGGALSISARFVQSSRFKVQSPEEKNVEPGTLNVEPDGDFIEISVTDTGEGISPVNMKKLFQPLFTTKARGIGLGLIVSKNLVEANGGRIEVESELGKETTFTVILPCEMNGKI